MKMAKHTINILWIGLLLCGCTYYSMVTVDNTIMAHLGDLTMKLTNKYLIGGWNNIDRVLLTFYPLITGLVYILLGFRSAKDYLIRIIWTFLILLSSVILALIVALFTWQNLEGDYMLLPKHIKHQPLSIYWTIFICMGILVSLLPILLKHNKDSNSNQTIDK